MNEQYAVVVTTINPPTRAVREIQDRAHELDSRFYVVGDTKSPTDFSLPGAEWLDVERQRALGFKFSEACPTRHYARKNIGYLAAMRDGATAIIETDDDNFPRDEFWLPRERRMTGDAVSTPGWCNVYAYFSDVQIWPRGLPLDRIRDKPSPTKSSAEGIDCPIQQGLADENPDVDAIFRLAFPLPLNFRKRPNVILREGVWCPFNSQNTTFWKPAFPLLYLPFYCSFRMTDIWRSFVAQRLAWSCGWSVGFHNSTVWQERNEHDLMRDFADEVPGYLHNERIRKTLEDLPLSGGLAALSADLVLAYEALIRLELVGSSERELLDAWRADLEKLEA